MNFWCYILSDLQDNILSKIQKYNYITFPFKKEIIHNDIIFFYIKNNANSGFQGYIQIDGEMKNNVKNIEIFNNKIMNTFICSVKYIKIMNKIIKKSHIFGKIKYLNNEFDKYKKSHNVFHQISDDLGVIIRNYLKNYTEIKKEKIIKDIPKEKEKEVITSKFIIPILIVPCKKFHRKYKKINSNLKIQWILNHISFCKLCDITNNNDRVSIDMIFGKTISYYKMTDEDEINTLLDLYFHLDYYKIKSMKENYFKIIRIYNSNNLYHKCFCIIGKLDTAF
jgi:hypothetical protein